MSWKSSPCSNRRSRSRNSRVPPASCASAWFLPVSPWLPPLSLQPLLSIPVTWLAWSVTATPAWLQLPNRLGRWRLTNYGTAQANAATADAAKATAINDRAAAVELQRAALSSAQDADVQRLAAEDARATAQANFGEAQRQASLATSRQLAALALGYQDSQPELASLLGNEAYRISQTCEARNVLLERLQNAIRLTATEVRPSIPSEKNDIRKVVFSPDGEHMAWSTFDGWVVLWNIPQFKEEFRI